MKKLNVFCLLFSFVTTLTAQQNVLTDKPKIGTQIDDYVFNNVSHYKKKRVSLNELRGRWLFLDFWYQGCPTNTKKLPAINELRKAFEKRMQFLMVAVNGSLGPDAEKVFGKLQHKLDTDMPVAFDSVLHKKWDIWAMPYILIIDPDGIIRAIADAQEPTVQQIEELMLGKNTIPNPEDRYHGNERTANITDTTMIYRSLLSKWSGEQPVGTLLSDYVKWPEADRKKTGIIFTCEPLQRLYATAFFGENRYVAKYYNGELYYPHAIIKTRDKSLFVYDTTHVTNKGLYNFRLDLPLHKSNDFGYAQKFLLKELESIYCHEVNVQKTPVSVWRLLALPGAVEKLKTSGGEPIMKITPIEMKFRNIPIETFCGVVAYYLMTEKRVTVDANETGITGNIDVTLDALVNDPHDMQRALSKYNLYLKHEIVEMNTLVIQDQGEGQ